MKLKVKATNETALSWIRSKYGDHINLGDTVEMSLISITTTGGFSHLLNGPTCVEVVDDTVAQSQARLVKVKPLNITETLEHLKELIG